MRHSHKFARKYVYTFSEGDASMREILGGLKNIEILDSQITLKSALTEGQLAQLDALADALAADL